MNFRLINICIMLYKYMKVLNRDCRNLLYGIGFTTILHLLPLFIYKETTNMGIS